jgi:hypothetical protein
MRYLTLLFFATCHLMAAIGDNAPAIPSTYLQSHPRLPFPSTADLTTIWNGGALSTRYNNAISAFSLTDGNILDARYVTIAYLAAKAAGHAGDAGPQAWLASLINYVKRWGSLGPTYWSEPNASVNITGCTTTCTITIPSVDLTTGCSGGSCSGIFISWKGYRYVLNPVLTAHTATIFTPSTYGPYSMPNGTRFPSGAGLAIDAFSSLYNLTPFALWHAVLADWIPAEILAAGVSTTDLKESLHAITTMLVNDFTSPSNGYSPYNDVMWLRWYGIAMAYSSIVNYPDDGARGLADLNKANEILFGTLYPVLKSMDFAGNGEGWGEYDLQAKSQYIVTAFLPWAYATHNYPGFFTVDNPGFKNYALYWMYTTLPNWMLDKIGDTLGYWQPEGTGICSVGTRFGNTFGALAEIYNDPHIRWFARVVNEECAAGPNGLDPSMWPWGPPDTNAKTVHDLSDLPLTLTLPNRGLTIMRTGWGEDDVYLRFNYEPGFWSKDHFDAGNVSIYGLGNLLNTSGTYGCGFQGPCRVLYGQQTIASNTVTISDPADTYPAQFVATSAANDPNPTFCGGTSSLGRVMPNDGGQRRAAGPHQYWWGSSDCPTVTQHQYSSIVSPNDLAQWQRSVDWYRKAVLYSYVADPSSRWFYVSANLTPAYTRMGSGRDSFTFATVPTPNTVDRTQRVQTFTRSVVMIPHVLGSFHSAYVIVKDEIVSTDSSFPKRILWHTINQPVVSGGQWTASRTENATVFAFNSGTWPNGAMSATWYPGVARITRRNQVSTVWHYQYNGKLSAWSFSPAAITNSIIGGVNHEFDDGTGILGGVGVNGTNQPLCQLTIVTGCDATNNNGLGTTLGEAHPDPKVTPYDPGSYRVETTFNTPSKADYAMHLFYAGSASDPVHAAISSVTLGSSGSGMSTLMTLDWDESNVNGSCHYHVAMNKFGATPTPTITAVGAGCVATI